MNPDVSIAHSLRPVLPGYKVIDGQRNLVGGHFVHQILANNTSVRDVGLLKRF